MISYIPQSLLPEDEQGVGSVWTITSAYIVSAKTLMCCKEKHIQGDEVTYISSAEVRLKMKLFKKNFQRFTFQVLKAEIGEWSSLFSLCQVQHTLAQHTHTHLRDGH